MKARILSALIFTTVILIPGCAAFEGRVGTVSIQPTVSDSVRVVPVKTVAFRATKADRLRVTVLSSQR